MTGLYPFPITRIGGITILESVALFFCYPRAIASRTWAAAYLTLESTCQTAIFYVSGDLRIAFAPTVYTFELLNPGLSLDRRGHFLLANGFVAQFAIIVLCEHVGSLGSTSTAELTMAAPLRAATVAIVFLCLNVAAFFISAARELLESRTNELDFARESLLIHSRALEQRVGERTAELAESYRALELTTSELRTFIYNITHDLKNPFNAILLTAELLRERHGTLLDAEALKDLQQIARTAGRGETMLRELLGLFNVTTSVEAPTLIDLNSLTAGAVELLQPQIQRRGVTITTGILPHIWGQPKKLEHVMVNLLGNAIKYVAPEAGVIDVSGSLGDGHVVLRIRDNGIGIPPAYHRRVFELFGRVPDSEQLVEGRSVGGTGVGLALVKRIVEEHEGDVWVESTPGQGSCFTVRFPTRD